MSEDRGGIAAGGVAQAAAVVIRSLNRNAVFDRLTGGPAASEIANDRTDGVINTKTADDCHERTPGKLLITDGEHADGLIAKGTRRLFFIEQEGEN